MRQLPPRFFFPWAQALALSLGTVGAFGADCNLNGLEDAEEVASGDAEDCNGDGFPDECDLVERLTGGAPGALVGLPRGGFSLAEDYVVWEPSGEPREAPVLIARFNPRELAMLVTASFETPSVEVFWSETEGGGDENQDGILDTCGEREFRRGDVDADDAVDISDAIGILQYLFAGSERIPCLRSADMNDNGHLDITDAIRLLRFLFLEGPAPVSPFPGCGTDTTENYLPCLSYPLCG